MTTNDNSLQTAESCQAIAKEKEEMETFIDSLICETCLYSEFLLLVLIIYKRFDFSNN